MRHTRSPDLLRAVSPSISLYLYIYIYLSLNVCSRDAGLVLEHMDDPRTIVASLSGSRAVRPVNSSRRVCRALAKSAVELAGKVIEAPGLHGLMAALFVEKRALRHPTATVSSREPSRCKGRRRGPPDSDAPGRDQPITGGESQPTTARTHWVIPVMHAVGTRVVPCWSRVRLADPIVM